MSLAVSQIEPKVEPEEESCVLPVSVRVNLSGYGSAASFFK
ncbi:MAG: hypothetical protein AAGA75_00405 [Cyanobacteria bacterium P01_E01_bin.6]